jgi:hypothetical protein
MTPRIAAHALLKTRRSKVQDPAEAIRVARDAVTVVVVEKSEHGVDLKVTFQSRNVHILKTGR